MKKIIFKTIYECSNCKRKILGYVDKCPICKGKTTKIVGDKLVTFIKG